jgi:YHS domain-containing protein
MRALIIVAATVLFCSHALAGSSISGAKDGVAIQGYDPVAYFAQKEAVRGKVAWAHEYAGTVWYFSSEDNRKAFAAEPAKYLPVLRSTGRRTVGGCLSRVAAVLRNLALSLPWIDRLLRVGKRTRAASQRLDADQLLPRNIR